MPGAGPDANPLPADSETLELSLLLVTYNSRDVLDGLIRSLHDTPPRCRYELIVADNASADDSALYLEQHVAGVRVMRQETNRGFAAGVNAAAEFARGEFLALINPDIAWESDPFTPLIQHLRTKRQIGAITPQLIFPDGRPQLSLRRFPTHQNIWWSRGTPWSGMLAESKRARTYTLDYPSDPAPIEATAAACLLVRRDAFEQIGRMDEGYFLYVEDTDLCRRLHDGGWEIWCDPTVKVRHAWSAASHRDAWHARQHRKGLRRYFHKFHPRARVKNAMLFCALACADFLSLFRSSSADRTAP